MWALDNRTPYPADSAWIRGPDGAEIWVVAVKVTHDILPNGSVSLASEQTPPSRGPEPHPQLASLRYDSDLGPAKAATDILLNGHAYSQNGRPITELPIGFRLGKVVRRAWVIGDRHWELGIFSDSISRTQPFVSMPLVAERAFGGDEPEHKRYSGNPLGQGAKPGAEGKIWLPNIEHPDAMVRHRRDRPGACLFGVIPSHWPARARYAGTYDAEWQANRYPLPPSDLDPRHWQLAPTEQQQPGHLNGGERVLLLNLTPPGFVRDGRAAFNLPKVSLNFDTLFQQGQRHSSRAVIHSVILEPDHPRVSVVYHMALPCHALVNQLQVTRITEKTRPLDPPCKPPAASEPWPLPPPRRHS